MWILLFSTELFTKISHADNHTAETSAGKHSSNLQQYYNFRVQGMGIFRLDFWCAWRFFWCTGVQKKISGAVMCNYYQLHNANYTIIVSVRKINLLFLNDARKYWKLKHDELLWSFEVDWKWETSPEIARFHISGRLDLKILGELLRSRSPHEHSSTELKISGAQMPYSALWL